MNNSTTFFKSVAKHNLERFHSECLTWLLNSNKEAAVSFIKELHARLILLSSECLGKLNISKEFIHLENNEIIFTDDVAKSEQDQIDIRLDYEIKKSGNITAQKFKMFIENKIKASEHFINSKKYGSLNSLKDCSKDISQTVYYYCREENRKDSDTKNIYVFLKPTLVNPVDLSYEMKGLLESNGYNFKQHNTWGFETENPWLSITYSDISNWLFDKFSGDKSEDKIIARSYLSFIGRFKKFVDFKDYNVNTESFNSFGSFEYFKILYYSLLYKFKQLQNKNGIKSEIYGEIAAGSSKGGDPLFNFYKIIKTGDLSFFRYIDTNKKESPRDVKVGIQLQGNSLKYFVSSVDYDNVTLNNEEPKKVEVRKEYEIWAKELFLKNATRHLEGERFKNSDTDYHPCSSKTFFSRSFKIDGFIDDNKKKDFKAKNIDELFDDLYSIIEKFVTQEFESFV